MINREKVIKGLKYLHDCEAWQEGVPPLFNRAEDRRKITQAAIELLKDQEAKSVIVTTNAYGTRFYHCPRCNRDLYAYPRQLYCSNCGQEVKWE